MRPFRSLRLQLALMFAAVALLPAAVLAAFVLGRAAEGAREQISARNAQTASALAGEVDQFLDGQLLHVREALLGWRRDDPAATRAHLAQHLEVNRALRSLLLAGPDARVKVAAPPDPDSVGTDLSGQPWLRAARASGAPTWSSAALSMQTGQPEVTLVVTGADGSAAVGFFDLAALAAIVERNRAGAAGGIAILDRDGTVIADRDGRRVRERASLEDVPLVREALAGRARAGEFAWEGRAWLGAAALVPATGWVVLVSEPVDVAYAPVAAFRAVFLAVLGAGLAAAIGLAVLSTRRILRPLDALAASARQLAAGEYAELPAGGDRSFRELDELTRSFARMTEAVRTREEALARSERNFRTLVSTPVVGVIRTELTGRILWANEAMEAIFGLPPASLEGESILRFYTDAAQRTEVVQAVLARGTARNVEVDVQAADGARRRVLINSALDGGTLTTVAVDVTESRRAAAEKERLEQQLRHAQKLEAVGRLAGGVAHDFNNLLTAIVSYASLVKEALAEDHPERVNVDGILQASERAAHLTQSLLAYSRKQLMQRRPADVREVIAAVEKLLRRLIGEDVELRVALPELRLGAVVDVGQLEQVLVNLCANARDAMPEGGTLRLEADRVDVEPDEARARGLPRAGPCVRLRVTDSGAGIPPEVQEKIFEPFFTTKAPGKGTGLGLAIVHGIVAQHEGAISVRSAPGQGTTFEILLPAEDGAAPGAQTSAAAGRAPGGTETILLAEDEPLVRGVLRKTLERAGYRVIEAEDGEEAVRRFAEHVGEVALCLLDVVMPRMNGRDAADAIAAARPGTRILLTSGYAADVLQSRGLAPGVDLVPKPIAPAELLRRVRAALDRPAAA